MSKKSDKPPVRVESPLWGEANMDPEDAAQGRDVFWVEGYSDKRQEFDHERSMQGLTGRRAQTQPMQFRFQYVSVERSNGTPLKAKEQGFRAKGYVPVTKENCKSFGVDPDKSGFLFDADGTCRVGSQMLMVCPADKVARHAAELERRNKEMLSAAKGRLEGAVDSYNARHPGYEPTSIDFEEKEGRDGTAPFDFEDKMFGKDK